MDGVVETQVDCLMDKESEQAGETAQGATRANLKHGVEGNVNEERTAQPTPVGDGTEDSDSDVSDDGDLYLKAHDDDYAPPSSDDEEKETWDIAPAISRARRSARCSTPPRKGTGYAILGIKKEIASKRVLRSSSGCKKAGSGVYTNKENDVIATKGGTPDSPVPKGMEMIPKNSLLNTVSHTNMEQEDRSDIPKTDTEGGSGTVTPKSNEKGTAKTLGAKKSSPSAECVADACRNNKSSLKCSHCGEKGTLAINGNTRFNGKTIKCSNCDKQYSGSTVITLLDSAIGRTWRTDALQGTATESRNSDDRQPVMDKSSKQQAVKTIIVPENVWMKTMATIEQLAEKQKSLVDGQRRMEMLLNKAQHRINKLENEVAITQRSNNAQERPSLRHTVSNPNTREKNMEEACEDTEARSRKVNLHYGQRVDDPLQTGDRMEVETEPTERTHQPTTLPVTGSHKGRKMTNRHPENKTIGDTEERTAQVNDHMGSRWIVATVGTARIPTCNTIRQQAINFEKVNWADVVRGKSRPEPPMPEELTGRIRKARETLLQEKVCAKPAPKITAVYFKNIRRGPIGTIRQALRECLPSWALLGLSFIGSSILEILTDERLTERLIGTLKLMGISHVPDFDVYGGAPRRVQDTSGHRDENKHTIELVIRRMTANIRVTLNKYAKEWYETMLRNAKDRLRQQAPSVENGSILDTTMGKEMENGDGNTMRTAGETNNAENERPNTVAQAASTTEADILMGEGAISETTKNAHEDGSPQKRLETVSRENTNQ